MALVDVESGDGGGDDKQAYLEGYRLTEGSTLCYS